MKESTVNVDLYVKRYFATPVNNGNCTITVYHRFLKITVLAKVPELYYIKWQR